MTEVEKQSKEIKLTVPWGHVAAKTYGSSTNRPVLMVHGITDNAGSFTRLIKYLPANLYYVCIDLPGHGWSSHFPPGLSINILDFVYSIHFILEALQWKKCIYISHSMGVEIGILFNIHEPARLEKIIAFDGFIFMHAMINSPVLHFKREYLLTIQRNNNNIKLQHYAKEEVIQNFKSVRTLNSEIINALFERSVTEVNGKYFYNLDMRVKAVIFSLSDPKQITEFVQEISVPLYIFLPSLGLQSLFYNATYGLARFINKKIPFKFIHIDGKHDVHISNPEIVAPFVCQILKTDNFSKL